MKSLLLLLFLSCCALNTAHSQIKTPESVGESILDLLNELQLDDLNSYLAWHLPPTIYEEMAKDKNLDKKIRESFVVMMEENWKSRYKLTFENLIKVGKEFEINWSKIKFKDFKFIEHLEDPIQGLEGELIFSYKEHLYSVRTGAILWKGEYTIIFVEELVLVKGND